MNSFVKGNPDLCIGCRTCMIGCVVAHEGLHIFEVDPDSYNFNPRLYMVKTAKISVPVQCKHCENPECLISCPEGAIYREDNCVMIATDQCIGCKACADACPYGAIAMVPLAGTRTADGLEKRVAYKCDLCHGIAAGPTCVRVCPTEALTLVTEEDLDEAMEAKRREAATAIAQEAAAQKVG